MHVWFLDLDDQASLSEETCRSWLSREEKTRSERFTHPILRRGFILTRGYLRGLLGHYLGIAPEDVELTTNAHGKPRLLQAGENEGLVFNLSHSGAMAALAFGHDIPLGIDIEHLRPRGNPERLASYSLSAVELYRWRLLRPELRDESFIHYWNAKEAFVKAIGRGITLGLKQVVVAEDFQGFQEVPMACDPASDWRLYQGQRHDYRYAMVYQGPQRDLRLFPNEADIPISPR